MAPLFLRLNQIASLVCLRGWRGLPSLVPIILILCGCEGLLFFPQQQLLRSPADVGLSYQEASIALDGGDTVHGWWLPAAGNAQATVLFAHGNAENISTHLASVYWLPARGVNVLLIDYRGYGKSIGSPSVVNAQLDVVAGLAWLAGQASERDTPWFVLGQSLGASVAGVAVARSGNKYPNMAGLVLDAGFSRYGDIAQEIAAGNWLTWSFQCFARWGMPDGQDLIDELAAIAPLPLLIIHGRQDPVVPYAHAAALYKAAQQPRRLLSYDGGHIETFNQAASAVQNREQLMDFISAAGEDWRLNRQLKRDSL
ncbi:alpha/beta hydrolase [Zhongshania guokunii]|uniref:Alpha/beta hydrolase n=1 Tax=Zhongshania guokunii TaxID=641783 RepID=A0ABV3U976_9GAMM